jgi:hypothetical protein
VLRKALKDTTRDLNVTASFVTFLNCKKIKEEDEGVETGFKVPNFF